jgi:acetyl-CoA C-acetyltransferase
MRKVNVIGVGQTSVSEHWGKSLKELAGEAVFAALADAERTTSDSLFVGNMLSGMLSRQENLGVLVADWTGLWGVEAVKVEAACGSGGAAVRAAINAIGSGLVDTAVVVGVEKMTETPPAEMTAALATAADAEWEVAAGISFVAINALIMRRYMYEYGWKEEHFAPFSINAHKNALTNPYARLHSAITEKQFVSARTVAAPINLLDASPIGDGAAALYLAAAELVNQNGLQIQVLASSLSTDTIAVNSRKNGTWLAAAERSAQHAYQQAGITPADIDVFEYHDAFSIMAALSMEASGFAGRGEGPRLALEGEILPQGKIPVATFGGLKARGHPVGATGVYQIVEVVCQLRGEAGPNQIPDARIGMAQNIGGSGATVVTHILEKFP